ncbi:hypothetical protein [Pseudomonas sp. 7-41]|uniref:hypothetical protein n=1 Tax=Pseudomonas sp. 7-41 TaxID=2898483 RepID=UPI001E5B90A8|nr:hypothetical protein [Pseudomonas sp. 7-41]UHG95828.1 hypothetical protein LQ249_19240 [Pseudomonas sp. 7-41]
MSNQAQIDAIEQLLIAVLKSNPFKADAERVFEIANGGLAGSYGPPGSKQKVDAANYLNHLKLQLK